MLTHLDAVIFCSGEFEAKDDDDSDSDFDDSFGGNQDLCLPALQYLRQCADFLATMWLMPNCPIFVGANRWECKDRRLRLYICLYKDKKPLRSIKTEVTLMSRRFLED